MTNAARSSPDAVGRRWSPHHSDDVATAHADFGSITIGYRWIILGVLLLARFALGFQFQSVASLGPDLMHDFALAYAQLGTLIGLYMLPGVVVALPAGMLGQRYGDKPMVMIGLLAMIAGGIICGAAPTNAAIAMGRVVSGVGAAVLAVLMNKMITDWFADKELFIGMSIYIIGWPVGIAAAQATQSQLGQTIGWRGVFFVTAILLAVALLAAALLYRPAPIEQKPARVVASRLSRQEVWLICIVGWIWMLLNCAYVVLLSFGPVLVVERGSPTIEAGRVVSLMSWVFFFALPLGGLLATRYRAPNVVMAAGLAGAVVFGVLVVVLDWPRLTFALLGIALAIATPVVGSLPSEVLRPANRATGFGFYYVWYYTGVAVAPAVGGLIHDVTQTASAPTSFATAMLLGSLCLFGLFRLEQVRLGAVAKA